MGAQEVTSGPEVLLVDDQEFMRRAMRRNLEDAGIPITGEAADGEEAVRVALDLCPDVILMDLDMPRVSGLEATRRLASLAPRLPVLVFTASAAQSDIVEAIMAGAVGYMLKTAPTDEVVEALRTAAGGGSVIPPDIAGCLLERVRDRAPSTGEALMPADELRATLTTRELEVLKLLAAGHDNAEIGRTLFVSPNTVRNHVASILEKLQLENRVQAAVHAVRSGIV